MPTETIPFEILGHFEEIIDQETGKCYGTRPVAYRLPSDNPLSMAWPPPSYGYAGRKGWQFNKGDIIQIDKAHKGMQPFKFKADAECWIITHPICGRLKDPAYETQLKKHHKEFLDKRQGELGKEIHAQ